MIRSMIDLLPPEVKNSPEVTDILSATMPDFSLGKNVDTNEYSSYYPSIRAFSKSRPISYPQSFYDMKHGNDHHISSLPGMSGERSNGEQSKHKERQNLYP